MKPFVLGRSMSWFLAAALLAGTASVAAGSDGERRTLGTGAVALELQGVSVGYLRSASGGYPKAEVASGPGSGGPYLDKRLSAVTYEPLSLEIGAGMEKPVYEWIAAMWAGKNVRMSGAVQAVDYNGNVQSKSEFRDGLLIETILPTLDAGSKDPGYFRVNVASEQVRMSKGGGSVSSSLAAKQKPWLASNFRLEIPGLDCARVRRIDSFRVKRGVKELAIGTQRGALEPTALEFSNLTVTLPESDAETWLAWSKSVFIDGNVEEKTGDLVLLGNDLQSELARIHFTGLGLISVAPEAGEGTSPVRKVIATLYCERAALEWKAESGTVMNVRVFDR